MSVRRKVPVSDETVQRVADAVNLPIEYVRIHMMLPLYVEVRRVVIGADGEPQVKTTTCCCKAAGGLRRICARVSGNKTPCRCFCHSTKGPTQ